MAEAGAYFGADEDSNMTTATAAPGVASDSEDEAGPAAGRAGPALAHEPSDDLEMRFLQVCARPDTTFKYCSLAANNEAAPIAGACTSGLCSCLERTL